MTLVLFLRSGEGLIVCADRDASQEDLPDLRAPDVPRHQVRHHALAPTVSAFVLAPPALQEEFQLGIVDNPAPEPVAFASMVKRVQETVVESRARALKRREGFGDRQPSRIPFPDIQAVIVGSEGGKTRLVYVSETGDVEDRSRYEYEALGALEFFAHLHLQHFPYRDAGAEARELIAFMVLEDVCDSPFTPPQGPPRFALRGPPVLWRTNPHGELVRLPQERVVELAAESARVRSRVAQILAKWPASGASP